MTTPDPSESTAPEGPAGGRSGTELRRPTGGPLTQAPRSILVVMLSALGDAVMVLPVLTALRRSFPRASITWILQPGPAPLARGHPGVDRVILFHRTRGRGPGPLLRSGAALAETLRMVRRIADTDASGSFDLLLDLQVYLKAGLLTLLTPARIKVGFDRLRARDLNWLFTTHRIPPNPGRYAHVQDQYFEFLRFLGVDPHPVDYALAPTEEERGAQRLFYDELDAPACAVVLATSKPEKDWSPEGYAAVVTELKSSFGMQPVLVGGRSPREEAVAREVERLAPGAARDERADDLRRLLWLLEGAELVITPDTGPLHMARALGVPVVGLFGATNPRRSGPYRAFSELVVDGYSLYPGEEFGAEPVFRKDGMGRITPEMVLEKVAVARNPDRREDPS